MLGGVSAFSKFLVTRRQYHDYPIARQRDPVNTATVPSMRYLDAARTNPRPEFVSCCAPPRHVNVYIDVKNLHPQRVGISRLTELLLGCPSGLQSHCSVDWRVISEVEVDGKIKAKCRLLEVVVCTLVLEMMPWGRGR